MKYPVSHLVKPKIELLPKTKEKKVTTHKHPIKKPSFFKGTLWLSSIKIFSLIIIFLVIPYSFN